MGVYWHSYAGVISTEPEVIKQLIEEAANIYKSYKQVLEGSEDVTNVYDLTIEGNCILFHSNGYGCYGTDFEDARMMLFEFLFENYDKALVCFEMVEPRQSQEYCFNASWAKPDGKVDWDDFEAPNLGVRLISYFRHPDGFAKENMVSDRNTEGCEVFDSLKKAQQRLDQKLTYYMSES